MDGPNASAMLKGARQMIPGTTRASDFQNQQDSALAAIRSAVSKGRKSNMAKGRARNHLSASVDFQSTNLGRLPTLGLNQIRLEEFEK